MFRSLFNFGQRPPGWLPDPSRNLTVYVGMPLDRPKTWVKARGWRGNEMELEDGSVIRASEIVSHMLVYPNNELLSGERLFGPHPTGVKFLVPESVLSPEGPELLPDQIAFGKSVCELTDHDHRMRPDGTPIYTTTLRNISGGPIRIYAFAAFQRGWGKYVLSTVTGGYYTAEQFVSWYAVPEDGWISPGKSVRDDNNYGGNGGWAYFGVTKEGKLFIATDLAPFD